MDTKHHKYSRYVLLSIFGLAVAVLMGTVYIYTRIDAQPAQIKPIDTLPQQVEDEVLEKATSTNAVVEVQNDIQKAVPPSTVVTPLPEPVVTSTPSKSHNYSFGISLGETLSVASREEVRATLDDLILLGVGWIRVDLAWNSIQPSNKNTYLWTPFDTIVTEAHKRGIQVLPIITYTPQWARSEGCRTNSKCPPANPAEFAEFARVAVQRYASQGIHTWEVWNEPNIRKFWTGGADYEQYTTLLKYTYRAIHEEDAGALVISGGLAPTGSGGGNITAREFLEGMYEYGAKDYFDALGFHPYTFPLAPGDLKTTNAWSQMSELDWSLRSVMKGNGDTNKKIWLTEYGAPTNGPGKSTSDGSFSLWSYPDHVTEAYQARLLTEAIEAHREYSWSGPLFWYSYKDLGTNTNTVENFFGLHRFDGTQKPSYTALQILL